MPESNDTPDGWSEAAAAKQSEALQGLRLQIDAVDRELLALLNRRASLSLEVGRVKANTSGPVFRPQRERQILDNLASENSGPLPEEHLQYNVDQEALTKIVSNLLTVPYPSASRIRGLSRPRGYELVFRGCGSARESYGLPALQELPGGLRRRTRRRVRARRDPA